MNIIDLLKNQILEYAHKIFKPTMIKIFQDIIEGGENISVVQNFTKLLWLKKSKRKSKIEKCSNRNKHSIGIIKKVRTAGESIGKRIKQAKKKYANYSMKKNKSYRKKSKSHMGIVNGFHIQMKSQKMKRKNSTEFWLYIYNQHSLNTLK